MPGLTVNIDKYIDRMVSQKAKTASKLINVYDLPTGRIQEQTLMELKLHDGFHKTLERYKQYPWTLTKEQVAAIIGRYARVEPLQSPSKDLALHISLVPIPTINYVSGTGDTIPTITIVPVPYIKEVSGVGEIFPAIVSVPEPFVVNVYASGYADQEPLITFIPEPQISQIETPETEEQYVIRHGIFDSFDHDNPDTSPVESWASKEVSDVSGLKIDVPGNIGYVGVAIPAEASQPDLWYESGVNNGSMDGMFNSFNISLDGVSYVLYVTKEKTMWGDTNEGTTIEFYKFSVRQL